MFNQNYNYKDITIALAGICQALDCVQSIARNGQADKNDMNTIFNATLKLDSSSTEEIYGHPRDLYTGFKSITSQLSGSSTDTDFGRYLINIIALEKQFTNNSKMMNLVASRISQTNRLVNYQEDETIGSNVVEQLAATYKDSISTLSTKIQVTGNSKYLEQSTNQHLIRALLLGAIRSAVLWRQVGGKKRQFILNKQKLVETAKSFLQ